MTKKAATASGIGLLSLQRELIITILQEPGVALDTANVCRTLEIARRDPRVGLVWRLTNARADDVKWDKTTIPLPRVELKYRPKKYGLKFLSSVIPNLTTVAIYGYQSERDSDFVYYIRDLKNLKVLSLSYMKMSVETKQYLAEAVLALENLEELHIIGDSLGRMAAALQKLKKLRILILESYILLEYGTLAIAQVLPDLKNLEHFASRNNGSSADGLRTLAPALLQLPRLRALDLTSLYENIELLLPVLQQMTFLQELNIGGHLCDASALAQTLKPLTNLQKLDLHFSELNSQKIEILAPTLTLLTNLRILNLSHNHFGKDGMRHLLPALSELTNLRELDLSYSEKEGDHPMEDKDVEELVKVLPRFSRLQKLNLQSNPMNCTSATAIVKALEMLSNLKELIFPKISASPDNDLHPLAESLSKLENLRRLEIVGCTLSLEDSKALATAFPKLKYLRILSLANNDLTHESMIIMIDACSTLRYMEMLDISDNPAASKLNKSTLPGYICYDYTQKMIAH